MYAILWTILDCCRNHPLSSSSSHNDNNNPIITNPGLAVINDSIFSTPPMDHLFSLVLNQGNMLRTV